MDEFKVIGPCAVDGVEPGGTVSRRQLEKAGANIGALVGFHLEEVKAEAEPTPAGTSRKPKP